MSAKVHILKINEDYADSVLFGDKNFEVRINDRGFQKGDVVQFTPIDRKDGSIKVRHSLCTKEYEITYVLGSFVGLADGYVAFGIKEIEGGEA